MQKKIYFIEYLRAFAIIFVVIGHYLGSYLYLNTTGTIYQNILLPANNYYLSPFQKIYNLYIHLPFVGVAIFFLITGFITPFSIKKKGWSSYLIIRFFKIYPTYFFSFFLVLLVLSLNSHSSEIDFPIKFNILLANLFLVYDWFYLESVDIVTWTLLVQIKFYILAAFLHATGQFSNSRFNLIIGVFGIALSALFSLYIKNFDHHNVFFGFIYTVRYSSIYIMFIMLGVCFYNLYARLWSAKKFIILSLFIYLSFTSNLLLDLTFSLKTIFVSFNIGLILFLAFYLMKNKFKRFSLISFLALISYPLYLTHRVIGFTLLNLFNHAHIDINLSSAIITVLMIFLAYLIYILIEKPFYLLGKKLLDRLFPCDINLT